MSLARSAYERAREDQRRVNRLYRQYWWRRNRGNLLVAAIATGVLLLALMAEWRVFGGLG